MAERVSADQIMKAKEVDLLDYLQSKGETFKKEGKYYRHTDHDSLIIKDNMYAWNSRNEKGYGAINFAQMYYNMSFVEAVKDLSDDQYKTIDHDQQPERKEKKPFKYPEQYEVAGHNEIKRYLIDERKIDPRLVNWLIQKDLMAQDKRNNVVLKWREKGGTGKIVGAEQQGTVKMNNKRGSFKRIMPNSKLHTGFTVDVGRPNKIHFFESPIDLMSYWSLKQEKLKDTRLVSMNGLKPKTVFQSFLEARNEGLPINSIVLAVDNDKGGKEFIKKMRDQVNENYFNTDIPSREKDWNDVLKKQATPQNQRPKEPERSV